MPLLGGVYLGAYIMKGIYNGIVREILANGSTLGDVSSGEEEGRRISKGRIRAFTV